MKRRQQQQQIKINQLCSLRCLYFTKNDDGQRDIKKLNGQDLHMLIKGKRNACEIHRPIRNSEYISTNKDKDKGKEKWKREKEHKQNLYFRSK